MKVDILTSGYVSMDHIIKIRGKAKPGFTSLIQNVSNNKIYYGGCSVNIAAALCKLNITTVPIIRVGNDYKEIGFHKFLMDMGISVNGLTLVENEITSVCYLIQDEEDEHITIFYPGAMDEKYAKPLPDSLFENVRLGVITVASKKDNEEFLSKCKQYHIPVAFGMKDDMEAFPKEFLKDILSYAKVIFLNQAECNVITNLYHLNTIEDLFITGNMDCLVITKGSQGSTCYVRQAGSIERIEVESLAVKEVVDVAGGGDGYMSGFLYGYLNGYDIRTCCKLGSALASFVLEKEGCCTNLPTEERLWERVKER